MKKSTNRVEINELSSEGGSNKSLLEPSGGNNSMEDTIVINGKKYKYMIEEGIPTLVRYDETYKVWVKLKFLGRKDGEDLEKYIIDALKNEYLKRIKEKISQGFNG